MTTSIARLSLNGKVQAAVNGYDLDDPSDRLRVMAAIIEHSSELYDQSMWMGAGEASWNVTPDPADYVNLVQDLFDDEDVHGNTCNIHGCLAGWGNAMIGWGNASHLVIFPEDRVLFGQTSNHMSDEVIRWYKAGMKAYGLSRWLADRIFDGDFGRVDDDEVARQCDEAGDEGYNAVVKYFPCFGGYRDRDLEGIVKFLRFLADIPEHRRQECRFEPSNPDAFDDILAMMDRVGASPTHSADDLGIDSDDAGVDPEGNVIDG